MSIRSTGGDLVPRDVAQVVAQVRQANRGRKQRGGSIGRALSWFKGKRKRRKRKKGYGNGQSRVVRPDDGLQKSHDPSKAVPRQEDKPVGRSTASQHFQENVFVESSRPQYLVDLHSEAQEGLKILQQEEKENDIDFQDDQSISSAVTLQPEEEASFGDRGSVDSRSIAADTMSMVSAQSIRSTQSAFTRKGSTFRPLNQGSHGGESAWRKDRRTTVVGIPQHVQKELGLDRAALLRHTVDGQLPNGGNMVITDTNGESPASGQQEQNVHLQALKSLHSSSAEEQLKQHIETMYRGGPHPSPLLKHHLLGAPGGTIEGILQKPPSPVMSISPQASYLSKIIPNAVMPSDVDVVEITRSRSRNSMRTLSKSSLVTASPAPSRASDRYSTYNRYELSSRGSAWSRSDSSDTIVSSSSTASSQGGGSTPRVSRKVLGEACGTERNGMKVPKQFSVINSVSGTSLSLKANGKVKATWREEMEGLRRDHFVRSMSVTKMKRPPPPPRRANSLHQDRFRHQKQTPLNQVDMQKSTPYPLSSYSSQGSTPTKGDKSKTTELSQILLPSTTLVPVHKEAQANGVPFAALSTTVTAASSKIASPTAAIVLKELFDIPEPPRVAAPLSPPPETWIHNRRTLSLLCGLGANRLGAPKWKQQKQESRAKERGELVGNGTITPLSGTERKGKSTSAQSTAESAAHIWALKTQEDPVVLKRGQINPVVQKKELAPVGKSSPMVKKAEPEQAQASPGTPGKRMFFLANRKKSKASPEVQKKEPKGRRDKVSESPLTQQRKVMLPGPQDGNPTAPSTSAPPSPPPAHYPPPPPSKPVTTSSVLSPPSIQQLSAPVFERQDEADFLLCPLVTPPLEGAAKTTTSLLVPAAMNMPTKTISTAWTLTEDIPPPPQQSPPLPPVSTPPALPLNVIPEGIPPPPQQAPPLPPVTIPPAPPLTVFSEGVPPPPPQAPPPPPVTVPPAPLLNVQPAGNSTTPKQDPPLVSVTIPPAPQLNVPPAPPLPVHDKSTGLKQPSVATVEGKEQKPLSRSKSTPIPKEDASLPVVTPSLLHMIRLRSVHTAGGSKSVDQNSIDHEEEPQKPIHKHSSETQFPPTVTFNPPSIASSPPKITSAKLDMSTPHAETASPPSTRVASTPTVSAGSSAAKPAPSSTSETGMPKLEPPAVVSTPAPKPTLKFASVATTPAFSKMIPRPSVETLPQPPIKHATPTMTAVPLTTITPLPSSEHIPPISLSTTATLPTMTSTTAAQSTAAPNVSTMSTETASQATTTTVTTTKTTTIPIAPAVLSPATHTMSAIDSTTVFTPTAAQSTAAVIVPTPTTSTASLSTPTLTGTSTATPTAATMPMAPPSMRLQEAIRMKAAAMSRDGPVARLNVRTSVSSLSPRSPEGGDLNKSPASTASFIFSKKSMETLSSTDTQSDLRKNLVTEGQLRSLKVPPPVSKKPTSHLPNSSDKPGVSKEVEQETPADHQP